MSSGNVGVVSLRGDQRHAPKPNQSPDRKDERIDVQKRNGQALSRPKGRSASDNNRKSRNDADPQPNNFHDANARQRGHGPDRHIEFARNHRESDADGNEARHDRAVKQRRNANR